MGLAPVLREKSEGNTSRITAKLVAEAADDGDDACRDAIEMAGRYLGIAVANLVTAIHPDLIVIGGGVSRIGEVLIERIRTEVVERVPIYPPDTIHVEPSLLSDKAGILGAVALAARGL